jgi:hypothetical protein
MEETIWLYFSILAVLIALSVIGTLVFKNATKMQHEHFISSLEELKAQCDFVCASAEDTSLPVSVTLPSGLYLYTNGEKICGTLEDSRRCQMCRCELQAYEMNLDTSFARSVFQSHDYVCYFKRLKDAVEIDCQG